MRQTVLAALVLSTVSLLGFAQDAPSERRNDRAQERDRRAAEREEARRLEKLDPADRAAVQYAIGFVAPEFTGGLDWLGNDAPSMESLRGRVVVIQTFTTRNAGSRALPGRIAKALNEKAPELAGEVQVIAIHTPEGADKAAAILEKADLVAPTAIDRDGAFCDAIGAFKRPVNLVIDRTGDVRFAGLTIDGVVEVAKELAAQPYDPANKPTVRRPESSRLTSEFPTFRNAVARATDLRGKQAPPLGNIDWWNGAPRIENRLVVVDFWATWCGPCRKAIPHMNDLARAFGGDVVCLGISDESNSKFEQGTRQHNIKKSDFQYPVGVDTTAAMKNGFGVKAIPHCAVISSDGIVRWQGHPEELTADALRSMVEANKALASRGSAGGSIAERWKREIEDSSSRGSQRAPRRGY